MITLFILSVNLLALTAKLIYELYIDGRSASDTVLQDTEAVCTVEEFKIPYDEESQKCRSTLYTVR